MYLWKCWHDTRVKVFVILGLFICQGIAFPGHIGGATNANGTQLRGMFLWLLISGGFIVQFVSWILGDDNVGADIGRGSGDFLLTRPSSRGYLVWTGWMVGMVESIVLWIVFSAISVGNLISYLHHQGLAAATISSSWLAFTKLNLPAVFLMSVINIGLIYGLTYCVGVITRSGSRALIGSAALIFGYQILKSILLHRFHLVLPEFLLAFLGSDHTLEPPAVHSFVIRGALALTFPVLVHFALERMEVNS